jgi:hypothetical protein
MKSSWTRLIDKLKGRRPEDRESEFLVLFMNHHKQADEMIMDNQGTPMAAIYFTPQALDKMRTKSIFKDIRDRTSYAYENKK